MAASHHELLHTLIALALVSITSVVGSVSFALGKRLQTAVPYLVSAAAGALLGTALYNLVPEALDHSVSSRRVGLLLTLGFVLSFVLEQILGMLVRHRQNESVTEEETEIAMAVGQTASIHHSHEHHHHSGKSLVTNVLLSGAIHSLVDGIGIAAAFASSHTAGVAITIAVLLHEVPHHIADVGVMIYSGIAKKRAILLNLLATTGCASGGVIVLIFGSNVRALTTTLLPITAANFIYISVGILMPELQREKNGRRSMLQMASLVTAVFLVSSISYYFPESKSASLVAQLRK